MPSRYGVDKSLNSLEGMSAYENGGKGSGNFGHKGRPGEVGGSGDGMGVTVAEDKVDQMQVYLCRRGTVSCGTKNIGNDQFSGGEAKDYYAEYGYIAEMTVCDSHVQNRKDFAEATRLTDEITKLTWNYKREDSEWVEGSDSVGMLKERIKGNSEVLLSEMATYYHGLFDDGKGEERVNNIADSIRKDMSLLREKAVGLKPQRKALANRVVKVGEKVLKMKDRTGRYVKHFAVTEEGNVHMLTDWGENGYRLSKDDVKGGR